MRHNDFDEKASLNFQLFIFIYLPKSANRFDFLWLSVGLATYLQMIIVR